MRRAFGDSLHSSRTILYISQRVACKSRNPSILKRFQSHAARNPGKRRVLLLSSSTLAVGSTATYLLSHPPPVPASTLSSEDPLESLEPQQLWRTAPHLHHLTAGQLLRSYFVYLTASSATLVDWAPTLINRIRDAETSIPLLGPLLWRLVQAGMRVTYFDHFCAGETPKECVSMMHTLLQSGVGSLLNFSVEAEEVPGEIDAHEPIWNHFVDAINDAITQSSLFPSKSSTHSGTSIKPTWVAIKCELVLRYRARHLTVNCMLQVSGLLKDPSVLEKASNSLLSSSAYQRGQDLPTNKLFLDSPNLSDDDHISLRALHKALQTLCGHAKDLGVRVDLDAEQSWFQPAIDRYHQVLSEEFNIANAQSSGPIVYNTYQCYLKSARDRLEAAYRHAQTHQLGFAAKLVRGAYVESEKTRAIKYRTENPVFSSKDQTDACFNECARFMTDLVIEDARRGSGPARIGCMFATQNVQSVQSILRHLRGQNLIFNKDGKLVVDDVLRVRIVFAQLLGMADNLTWTLLDIFAPPQSPASWTDINAPLPIVLKYLPFGAVGQTIPYLVRRAQENKAILQGSATSSSGAAAERIACGKEIRRRLLRLL